ncbi:retinol dehydrogenase 14-like isoform X2 [Contarinia nasturtii]|uniref:retinol dehydrogenase 14-like isoform X2 n=1 Tax=Contarinia nasturtii TaxID=265458 RepID=UPI0012D490AE|nr:retinol dehydrogenase 14-like isoform X2 [Contarinia nasturtii]
MNTIKLSGVLNFARKWIQGGQFHNVDRIDGKVIVVTGCNTGIGKETVMDLAQRGAHIHMACRDYKRCEITRQEIIAKTGNHNVFNRELDLASMDSIRKFVAKFLQEEKRLDILINNAGVMAMPKNLTKDGFEMQLGVNHLGHFLLTNLLLDILKSSTPSRIIVLSSLAHKYGEINRADLNSEKSYNKFKAYSQSKLANILFTQELARRLKGTGVTCNAVHPGVVKTDLGRHLVHSLIKKLIDPFTYFFFKTAKSGAQTTIRLAVDPELEKVTGQYFADCKQQKVAPSARKNNNDAEWLWKESEKMTRLSSHTHPV